MPAFLSAAERSLALGIDGLSYCNPFLPQRLEYERRVLGSAPAAKGAVWNMRVGPNRGVDQLELLRQRGESLIELLLARLLDGARPSDADIALYESVVLFTLYHRYRAEFEEALNDALEHEKLLKISFYSQFHRDMLHYLELPGFSLGAAQEIPHLFACFFQLRRAFHQIFRNIVGGSMPAAKLRAEVWQSIFTHDVRRFRRSLYNRMGDIATLITGPTGTGKELVARAIGLSRYIPFDPKTQKFTEDFTGSFQALSLSALSPTLIESEIFGHRRGSYTGAVTDRAGWLEMCRPLGTVFLDEIGELDGVIQVKLLRLLQTRTYQRLGDTNTRHFTGKIIAATNRDLAALMQAGTFREDFFYRICSDMITTPSLREQLADSPAELRNLVLFIAQRIAGDEAPALTEEVLTCIEQHIGIEYAWPGNIRELEQCVRNVMIRQEYHPPQVSGASADVRTRLSESFLAGEGTADDLLRRYCTIIYAQTSNYEAAARRLQIDRRTVKAKIDHQLLDELKPKAT